MTGPNSDKPMHVGYIGPGFGLNLVVMVLVLDIGFGLEAVLFDVN